MGFLDFLKGKKRRGITFEGGPGDTIERAVIIRGAPNNALGVEAEYRYLAWKFLGVEAEYRYLAWKFGRPGIDWELVGQGLVESAGHCKYDKMHIKLADGTQRTIYFDITEFFGKGFDHFPLPW
jgi:hypothetical protein